MQFLTSPVLAVLMALAGPVLAACTEPYAGRPNDLSRKSSCTRASNTRFDCGFGHVESQGGGSVVVAIELSRTGRPYIDCGNGVTFTTICTASGGAPKSFAVFFAGCNGISSADYYY